MNSILSLVPIKGNKYLNLFFFIPITEYQCPPKFIIILVRLSNFQKDLIDVHVSKGHFSCISDGNYL